LGFQVELCKQQIEKVMFKAVRLLDLLLDLAGACRCTW